jgi:predicted DNA-binding transcriptional regulator AlpA
MQVPSSDLMRDRETADMLLMSTKTLANKRSRGDGGPPYVRLSGGAIRYSRRAVQEWIDQHTVTPGGGAAA